MSKALTNSPGGSVQKSFDATIPPLVSPLRPEYVQLPLVSAAKTLIPAPLIATSRINRQPVYKDRFFSKAKGVKNYVPPLLRTDIANGQVSEEEVKIGRSKRPIQDPEWFLDTSYLRHVRKLQGLVKEEAEVKASDLSDLELYYQPLFPVHLYKTKSTILQLCSSDPESTRNAVKSIQLHHELSATTDVNWGRSLFFDFGSNDPIAKGRVLVSDCYTSPMTLYKKSNTYVCFLANATVVVGSDEKITEPFIFIADSSLGNEIYPRLAQDKGHCVAEFETYSADLISSKSAKVSELFLLKSLVT